MVVCGGGGGARAAAGGGGVGCRRHDELYREPYRLNFSTFEPRLCLSHYYWYS